MGVTAIVYLPMNLRTGTGGVVRRIVVRDGTSCITIIVAYIPVPGIAAMASTSAVSRPPKV